MFSSEIFSAKNSSSNFVCPYGLIGFLGNSSLMGIVLVSP
jgi:hypothetical protein